MPLIKQSGPYYKTKTYQSGKERGCGVEKGRRAVKEACREEVELIINMYETVKELTQLKRKNQSSFYN